MEANGATWVAVALAAVSMIGSAIGAVTAAFVKIAQTRQDAETAALRVKAENAEKRSADCEQKHAECQEQHATTELRLRDIEAALAKKKDETAEHKPVTPA